MQHLMTNCIIYREYIAKGIASFIFRFRAGVTNYTIDSMQTIYHANDSQELTNISEHVRGCKHYKNPSLGVGTTQTERLGERATQNDLCEEENCSNDPQCCTDNAEAEIDCVSGDHIHMIAEGQTNEGGRMRAGHHCCCTAAALQNLQRR